MMAMAIAIHNIPEVGHKYQSVIFSLGVHSHAYHSVPVS